MIDRYSFAGLEKTWSLIALVVGLVLFAIGVFLNIDNPTRIWTALLYNNTFFLILGVVALFFIASQTTGYNGWYVLIKRIPEAMSGFILIGGILMLLILFFGWEHIYHWSDVELFDKSSPKYDSILASKRPFLNPTVFFSFSIAYIILWSLFAFLMRRNSLQSDKDFDLKYYNKSKVYSAIYLLIFGVSSSTAMWHWFMSIQPHWFSTLFGWYCFISTFVTCMAFIILITIYLQSKGHMKWVTDEHLHDLGKLMFAFSVAWAYLFFSQFMLIWYSNIPEETLYYKIRIAHYPAIMYMCVVLNFIVPFFVLITRGAKRTKQIMIAGACLIIFGHWLDYYQMTMPAAIKEAHLHDAAGHTIHSVSLGVLELGLGIAYLGLFAFVVFRQLAKASLVQVNHPFLKESMIHHT